MQPLLNRRLNPTWKRKIIFRERSHLNERKWVKLSERMVRTRTTEKTLEDNVPKPRSMSGCDPILRSVIRRSVPARHEFLAPRDRAAVDRATWTTHFRAVKER